MINSVIQKFTLILLLYSCSHFSSNTKISDFHSKYQFKDKTGEYQFERNIKLKNNQIVSKVTLSPLLKKDLDLEKIISISEFGTVGKNKKTVLRPKISQSTIWLDKKKYFSQLSIDLKKKSLEVIMQSPEDKWSGKKTISFPKGDIFCFFSQLPECLKFYGLINPSPRSSELLIIWDSYPYHSEIYANLSEEVFSVAAIEYSGMQGKLKKYTLNLGNQIIFYLFNNDNEFERMYWIAQGITIINN